MRHFIIAILILTFFSCKKEEAPINNMPSCVIAHPMDGEVFALGNTISISVDATDSDGMIIKVHFFVDGVEVGSDETSPYKYDYNTSSLNAGIHSIKCTSIDDAGGSASDEITITLIEVGLFIDSRDGQEYETIEIGNQVWFADNLNFVTANSTYYSGDPIIGEEYGSLYDWEDANTACPDGWHLPSDEEWMTLEAYLGMAEDQLDELSWRGTNEGSKLKCGYGWSSVDTSSNSSYFSALPGGYYSPDSMSFIGGGNDGMWWTSTSVTTVNAYYRQLKANDYQVLRSIIQKDVKISVRCIKD